MMEADSTESLSKSLRMLKYRWFYPMGGIKKITFLTIPFGRYIMYGIAVLKGGSEERKLIDADCWDPGRHIPR
jgi:hypothetical protein